MTKRDVGRMGEGLFIQLCADAGLTANAPNSDRGAWDFLVQFPTPPPDPGVLSLDRLPSAPNCWVQVKSRGSGDSAPSIKLSNWHRMCAPELPFFILVLTYDGGAVPTTAHLVHVDEKLVADVLKRLRKMALEQASRLHRHSMVVPCLPENELGAIDGSTLRAGLERHIGRNPRAYFEAKKRWLDTVGYEGPRFRGSLRELGRPGTDIEDQLVDLALGLSDYLPAKLVSLDEIRFGIPVPAYPARPLSADARLSLAKLPSMPASIEVRDASGTERACFDGEFLNPKQVFPFVSDERLRFRINGPFFEMVLKTASEDADLAFRMPLPDEQHPLSAFAPAFRIFDWLLGDSKELHMTIRLPHVTAETKLRSGRLFDASRELQEVVRAGLDAAALVRCLGLDQEMPVTILELAAARLLLADAAKIATANGHEMELGGDATEDAPPDLRVGYPMVSGAPIGRTLVLVGIAYYGTPAYDPPSGGRKRFKVSAPERQVVFVETIVMDPGKTYTAEAQVERVSRWLEERQIAVLPHSLAEPGHTIGKAISSGSTRV